MVPQIIRLSFAEHDLVFFDIHGYLGIAPDQKRVTNHGSEVGWNHGYPLVNIQKAIENGHRNSGFTQLKYGDFP